MGRKPRKPRKPSKAKKFTAWVRKKLAPMAGEAPVAKTVNDDLPEGGAGQDATAEQDLPDPNELHDMNDLRR